MRRLIDVAHKLQTVAVVFIAVAAVTSCSHEISVTVGEDARYHSLKDGDIIAVVNHSALTRRMVEQETALRTKLFISRFPRVDASKVAHFGQMTRRRIVESFCERELLIQIAERNGSHIDHNIAADLSHKYTAMLGEKKTLDFATALQECHFLSSEDKAILSNIKRNDTLVESWLTHCYSDKLLVAEAEVSNAVARIARGEELVSITNAVILETATKLRDRILAGEDFATLADGYSQESPREIGGKLIGYSQSDFDGEMEGYWNRVSHLAPGEMSEVIDTDYSFDLVKRDNDIDGEMSFSRIMLLKAQAFANQTPDEIRQMFRLEKRSALISEILATELANNRVVPPPPKLFNR